MNITMEVKAIFNIMSSIIVSQLIEVLPKDQCNTYWILSPLNWVRIKTGNSFTWKWPSSLVGGTSNLKT